MDDDVMRLARVLAAALIRGVDNMTRDELKDRVTARIYQYPTIPSAGLAGGGWGWVLFQGADCVGTSEKACSCVDAARRAAQRYSDRFGYGRIESATVTRGETEV